MTVVFIVVDRFSHQHHATADAQGFHQRLTAVRAKVYLQSELLLPRMIMHIAANGTTITATVMEL
jgi:hypothetical protein